MTPVDTLYEYAGLKLAGLLHGILAGAGLPLILGSAGVAYVVHRLASDRASPRDLGAYVLFLVFAAWLLSPVQGGEVRAPRFLVYLGSAADLLQKRAARAIQERFLDAPFEWERVAALAAFARILDPALAREAGAFLEACAKPALARAEPRGANLFREGTLPYRDACEARRAELWARLREHVETEPLHRQALRAARRHDPGGAAAFRERYLEELARRAADEPGSPTHETALVLASVGEYSYTDPAQSVGRLPGWADALGGALFLIPGAHEAAERALNAVLSGAAALEQSWQGRFAAKQQYFIAVSYGPVVYGLALLLLLGLFPVAGLAALLPGQWKVLLHYGKVFVSVKLWPVGWAALSSFNARRPALEAFEPGGRGPQDPWLALAAMYLITPAVAFLIVHLTSAAAAFPFAAAAPPPAGAGAGPAGALARVAAARGR
jgi:hypothetical protein